MSPATDGTKARRGFPRWAWVVSAIVLLLGVVVAVSYWYQANPPKPAATPGPTPTAGTVDSPDGCLTGATNNTAAALLQAQKEAPHTETGAIEVGAAVMRWAGQYPRPSVKDGDRVATAVLAEGATGKIATLAENLRQAKSYPGVTSARVSFAKGRYAVEESTADMVRVTVGGFQIQNGQELDEQVAATLTMVWEGDMWKIRNDGIDRDLDELFSTGSAFAGGC